MRILAGKFKKKQIFVPRDSRPVLLRVRKSCFDILNGEFEGAKVLDLFAGSGSLGLEAISRGAKEVTFVDLSKNALIALKKNIAFFTIASQARFYKKDSFDAIRDFYTYRESFDVIFLDPPYYKGMLKNALQTLDDYDILSNPGYLVAFCYSKDDFVKQSRKFSLILERAYGQTTVLIYQKSKL